MLDGLLCDLLRYLSFMSQKIKFQNGIINMINSKHLVWKLLKILIGNVTSHTMQWITAIFFGSRDSHESTLSQKALIISRDGTWLSSKGYASTRP